MSTTFMYIFPHGDCHKTVTALLSPLGSWAGAACSRRQEDGLHQGSLVPQAHGGVTAVPEPSLTKRLNPYALSFYMKFSTKHYKKCHPLYNIHATLQYKHESNQHHPEDRVPTGASSITRKQFGKWTKA